MRSLSHRLRRLWDAHPVGCVLAGAVLFGVVFWVVDGTLNYYFFRDYLRRMMFERPQTVLESTLTNLSGYALFVRGSFMAACAIGGLLVSLFVIAQKRTENELREQRRSLQDTVARQTQELRERAIQLAQSNADLQASNAELQTFSYSIAHDLRAPLRSMDGFCQAILEDWPAEIDDRAVGYLNRVLSAVSRMDGMIDGLLLLSRVTRDALTLEEVDLSELAAKFRDTVVDGERGNGVRFAIQDGVVALADRGLVCLLMQNLLDNALKFSGSAAHPLLEFGVLPAGHGTVYFVRDNGAGFDMAYAHKLFLPFERLHNDKEYPGHGIGLATARRIVERHNGRIWAEGIVGSGATFYFTLEQEGDSSGAEDHPPG
jgi:light-regulated signal transduction histidine kinase (bacteriophytochrome)